MGRKTNQGKLRIEIEELGVLVRGGAYGVGAATKVMSPNPKFQQMERGGNTSAAVSQMAAWVSLSGAGASAGPISAAVCASGGMVCKAVG
jgi:hypothetical protein